MSLDKPGLPFAPVYLKVAYRLLDSDESGQSTPIVRAAIYGFLGKSLLHHSSAIDERIFEDLLGFVVRGMKDSERIVRLAAGSDPTVRHAYLD